MVNRIKLLGDLEERVSVMREEIFMFDRENYNGAVIWLEKALGLMKKLYEDIRKNFPDEPIVKFIDKYYSDAWDVMVLPTYEERFDYAM